MSHPDAGIHDANEYKAQLPHSLTLSRGRIPAALPSPSSCSVRGGFLCRRRYDVAHDAIGSGRRPLVRLAIALALVGVCLAWLFSEWDRRVKRGFGAKPAPAVSMTALAPLATAVKEQRLPTPATLPATAPAVDVYFSPDGGASDAIVRELGQANQRVRVQAYSFTSAPIARAVVDAIAGASR